MKTKDAWVLRLKEESKELGMTGEYYHDENGEELDWITDDLQKATLYKDKDKEIELMKEHEQTLINMFGKDAVINFGYTNMMKHFEFVEVELVDPV
ncbi:hypothetical protein NCCP2222_19400 [Sporosarcina sp. NCCP-2222]|uniref:hypothetical protein n=1 Tax=Sporosarcina sp. NCCP-2222 TaxID=2935073 RepID=UPI002084359C|nr:hypothetical protein [Sporosarcina sp. NCCP-2222]GKV55993.1 hypothetical protein NCCP2222_19400 [Sporosarcina sp. NCCP-2222]